MSQRLAEPPAAPAPEAERVETCALEPPRGFEELSQAEQRVAIAKDVIAQLDAGLYDARHAGYLGWEGRAVSARCAKEVERIFEGVLGGTQVCHVCGIGSLFVSIVKYGDVTPGEFFQASLDEGMGSGRAKLAKYFTQEQLSMIEYAFERSPTGHTRRYIGRDPQLCERVYSYTWRRLPDDRNERLRAIMQNVVDNGGEFKP